MRQGQRPKRARRGATTVEYLLLLAAAAVVLMVAAALLPGPMSLSFRSAAGATQPPAEGKPVIVQKSREQDRNSWP